MNRTLTLFFMIVSTACANPYVIRSATTIHTENSMAILPVYMAGEDVGMEIKDKYSTIQGTYLFDRPKEYQAAKMTDIEFRVPIVVAKGNESEINISFYLNDQLIHTDGTVPNDRLTSVVEAFEGSLVVDYTFRLNENELKRKNVVSLIYTQDHLVKDNQAFFLYFPVFQIHTEGKPNLNSDYDLTLRVDPSVEAFHYEGSESKRITKSKTIDLKTVEIVKGFVTTNG
ncbi:MAG: hypothetical protein AAF065_13875 [Verrucomicrobiota bacterium]